MAGGPLQFFRACGDAVVVGNGRIRTLRAEPWASSRARQTGIRRDGRRKWGIRRKRRLEREDAGRNTMRRNGLGQGSHSSAVQFATRKRRASIASGRRPCSPPGPGGDGSSLTQSRSALKTVQSVFLHALSFVESPRHGNSGGGLRDLGNFRWRACGVRPLPPRRSPRIVDSCGEAESSLTHPDCDLWLGRAFPAVAHRQPHLPSDEAGYGGRVPCVALSNQPVLCGPRPNPRKRAFGSRGDSS